jgi:SPP1 gp7 family putative phage head morphogenesis protein
MTYSHEEDGTVPSAAKPNTPKNITSPKPNMPKSTEPIKPQMPKAMESFVEKAQENMSDEEFFDAKTPEDELAERAFKELDKIFMQAVDQYFGEIEKSKIRLDEAVSTAMAPRALTRLDKTFELFNKNIDKIVAKVGNDMVDIVLTGDKAPQPSAKLQREIKRKAELLQRNFESQLRQFNQSKIQDIRRKITDGIAAGKSHAAIKAEIKKDIDTKLRRTNPHEYEIQRIVRTELGKSTNLLKMLKWQDQGFKQYRWVTAQDERVRPANESQAKVAAKEPWQDHRARHNQTYNIADALSGKDIFPGGSLNADKKNINCRCTAILWIDDEDGE